MHQLHEDHTAPGVLSSLDLCTSLAIMGATKKLGKRQQVVKPFKSPDLLTEADQVFGELCKLFKPSNLKAALKSGQLSRVADTIRSLVTTAAQQDSHLVTIPLLRQLHRVTSFVHLLLHIHTTKDPQHWNQRFCHALCSLLAASAALLQLAYPPSGLANDAAKRSKQAAWAVLEHSTVSMDRILQAATAVAEALQQHHKRQQEQEQEQQQQRTQGSKQQQLEQQEQLLRLQQVAAAILECWLPMQQLWVNYSPDDDKSAAVMEMLQPAVDLAAALVQTLSGDSAPQQFQVVAKVAYSIYLLERAEDRVDAYNAAYQQLLASPAFLQLSLSILLMHCYSAQRYDSGGGSSSSTSDGCSGGGSNGGSGCSSSGASGDGSSSAGGRGSGGGSCDSSNSKNGSSAGNPPEKDMQTLQQEQVHYTWQLWHNCGFVPSALKAFAAAAGSIKARALLPRDSDGFPALDSRKFVLLPGTAPAVQQGFVLAAAAVSASIAAMVTDGVPDRGLERFRVQLCLKGAGELQQQQRQQLQQFVWPLPVLLLLTAWVFSCNGSSSDSSGSCISRSGGSSGSSSSGGGSNYNSDSHSSSSNSSLNSLDTLVRSAVDVAATAVAVWSMPGLPLPTPDGSDAAAEAAAEAGSWASLNSAQYEFSLIQPMFDCWVQLMQQQLLRPSTGLLLQAARSRSIPAAGTSRQQLHQQVDSIRALRPCVCASAWVSDGRSSSWRCLSTGSISLNCTQQQVVAVLLVLLQRMSDRTTQTYGSSSGAAAQFMAPQMWGMWWSKAPAVMLSVEGLLRRILPATAFCDKLQKGRCSQRNRGAVSSSSSRGVSSSSFAGSSRIGGNRRTSSTAGMLRESFVACLSKKQYQTRLDRTLLAAITDGTPGASNHAFLFSYCVSMAKFCCLRPDLAATDMREVAISCAEIICCLASRTLEGLSQNSGLAASRALLAPVLVALGRLCIGVASALCEVRSSLLEQLAEFCSETATDPDPDSMYCFLPGGMIWAGSSTSMLLHNISLAAAAWGDLSQQQQQDQASLCGDNKDSTDEASAHQQQSLEMQLQQQQQQASLLLLPQSLQQQEQPPQQHQQQQQAAGASLVQGVASSAGAHSHYLQLGSLAHVLAAATHASTTSNDSSSSSNADALPVRDQPQHQQQQQRAWLLHDTLSLGRQCCEGLFVAIQEVLATRNSSSSSSKDSANTEGSLPAQASEQQQACAAVLQRLQPLLDGALLQLQQQLVAIGVEVCDAIPLPWLCNNPHCVNLECGSELMLVGGKGCVCGGCRVARYCSRDCQAAHWQQHKEVCKRISAGQQQWVQLQQA